jgi:Bax protein
MKKRKLFLLNLPLVLFFSGCDAKKIKLLKDDYLKTKIGTIKEQKLITTIEPKKKPKPKVKIKKVNKPKKKINKADLIPVSVKKENFKNILVPIVTKVYKELMEEYKTIRNAIHMQSDYEKIEALKVKFRAKSDGELIQALKPHPISIVLAQSAIESAWLTSRFSKEANNIFGVWSFNKNEPRIAANGMRGDRLIYLKKYDTLESAVRDYFKNIARNGAYKQFRYLRTVTDDPYVLVTGLTAYSEKGETYTKILASMIKSNKFYEYDIKD